MNSPSLWAGSPCRPVGAGFAPGSSPSWLPEHQPMEMSEPPQLGNAVLSEKGTDGAEVFFKLWHKPCPFPICQKDMFIVQFMHLKEKVIIKKTHWIIIRTLSTKIYQFIPWLWIKNKGTYYKCLPRLTHNFVVISAIHASMTPVGQRSDKIFFKITSMRVTSSRGQPYITCSAKPPYSFSLLFWACQNGHPCVWINQSQPFISDWTYRATFDHLVRTRTPAYVIFTAPSASHMQHRRLCAIRSPGGERKCIILSIASETSHMRQCSGGMHRMICRAYINTGCQISFVFTCLPVRFIT